jgi:predicted enzyme related to lactoylglutathione lyase
MAYWRLSVTCLACATAGEACTSLSPWRNPHVSPYRSDRFHQFPGADAATLQRVKAFYGKAFDWEFQDWGGTYVDTASSGLGAGFNADAAQAPRQPLPVILRWIWKRPWRRCRPPALISKAIFPFPGGRRFHFHDPAGNELAVWSPGERRRRTSDAPAGL